MIVYRNMLFGIRLISLNFVIQFFIIDLLRALLKISSLKLDFQIVFTIYRALFSIL